ncbi:MAG: hypothetical protein GYB24_05345 [Rhodobacteraceae bacterium]|nr:hypothetical protein [Paracoccaceae bacterium]
MIFTARRFFGLVAVVAGLIGALSYPAYAADETPQHIEAEMPPLPESQLDTRFENTQFNTAQQAFSANFATAEPARRSTAALDYAQFLISWMMLPEAQDLVEYSLNGATQDESERARAYLAMIDILSGDRTADREVPAALRLDPVWSVVAGLSAGDSVETDLLRSASTRLERHSPAVAGRLVPVLFDAAVANKDLDFARSLLNASEMGTDLAGTSQMLLMRGLLARAERQNQNAFDFFAWASEHQDRAAAQARIELANMALENPDRAVRERVRDLLVEGLARWRGDALALRMRALLARVSEDLGDAETAIISMASLHADHPETPEAELAERRIAVILGQMAEAIEADAMSLPDSLAMVRRLEPYMSAHTQRVEVRGALAGRFARAGLTVAAEAEYADIWDGLLEQEQAEISPALLDRLLLEQARRYQREDIPAAARNSIARRPVERVKDLDPEFAKIELLAGGTPANEGDATVSLEIGRYALSKNNEDAALSALSRAGALPSAEGIHAARIAAARGQSDVSGYLQSLIGDSREKVARLTTIRAAEAPQISPLSVEAARGIVERATSALEAVAALNTSD